jgi:hypothetical protein
MIVISWGWMAARYSPYVDPLLFLDNYLNEFRLGLYRGGTFPTSRASTSLIMGASNINGSGPFSCYRAPALTSTSLLLWYGLSITGHFSRLHAY